MLIEPVMLIYIDKSSFNMKKNYGNIFKDGKNMKNDKNQ